jgi:geranylgeranyl diphosphate synthase type I
MQAIVTSSIPSLQPLYTMLRYHLGWVDSAGRPVGNRPGKGIRPAICLLACQATGGDWQRAVPAAAAIELVHNFSLIHDDIEDRDAERRGRPTVWKLWGEAQAINAGDAMFVLSRLALHRLLDHGLPPVQVQAATLAFDRACLALCQGQFLDLSYEDRLDVTADEYLEMVSGKTAALLGLSAQLGALLGAGDPALAETYHRFGAELGIAFQIYDDVLGIWGDESQTGKAAGNDLRRRKKSFPVVYGLSRGAWAAGRSLADLYRQPTLADADVHLALAILDSVAARDHALAVAHAHYQAALAALDETDIENEAQDELHELAAFVVSRSG